MRRLEDVSGKNVSEAQHPQQQESNDVPSGGGSIAGGTAEQPLHHVTPWQNTKGTSSGCDCS